MNTIRPVSDLRNNFADISRTVHETAQPVFLTRNGYGDMVVMSMEAYENLQFESQVYFKLQDAVLHLHCRCFVGVPIRHSGKRKGRNSPALSANWL